VATGTQQRDLRINLSANQAGLERSLQRAGSAMERYQRSVEDASNAVARLEQELQRDIERTLAEVEANAAARAEAFASAGQGMLIAGAAITAGLGMAAQAAIEWESAWAGVTKVLDATPEQTERLEESLRDLALQIPVTSTELAGIAAAAAQLGVESQHIIGFTETIAAMSVATDMVAEEAAMQLARFGAIMGTPQADVDRLGASLVELGNNAAATESEIMTMAMRIAGAGQTVGLTEGEVLGFAASLASIGMEAEAGGSAVSRVLLSIDTAVTTSGEKLQGFASVAGMSAAEYAEAWANDPAAATQKFVAGLGEMNSQGENVVGTLDRLGLGEIVVRDALLRMAGASDMVGESLERGNTGWEENSALVEEAAARYATTESQIRIAQNAINETAISLGESLLPMLGDVAQRITDYGTAFGSLDDTQQQWITGISGGAGALALLTGALITVGPRMIEFRGQMQDLQAGGATRFQRSLGATASFLTGPYGAALGAVMLIGASWLDQKAQQIAAEEGWARAFAESNGVIDDSIRMRTIQRAEEEGLLELSQQAGISATLLTEALQEEGAAREALAGVTLAQTGALYESTEEAARAGSQTQLLKQYMEELYGPGVAWTDLTKEQRQALEDLFDPMSTVVSEIDAGRQAQEEIAAATEETSAQYLTAADAANTFRESISEVNSVLADAIDAELNYNSTLLRATETIAENSGATDLNTEAGINNHRALLDVISAGEREIETMIANGATTTELEGKKNELRGDVERLRNTVGLTDEQFSDYDDMLRNVEDRVDTQVEVTARGTYTTTKPGGEGQWVDEHLSYHADGGAVKGPGGPTEDRVRAMLSAGEHVWTAAEVQAAGGQEAMYAMRQLVKSGSLKFADGGVRHYARGGAVLPSSARIVNDHDEDTRISIQRLIVSTIDGTARQLAQDWKKHMQSGGSVVSAWRSQLGVPYSWGGGGVMGPGYGFAQGANIRGFDCSSLMQYGWHRAGVTLPRTTYDQINYGQPVAKGNERPGDLVFPHRGHVAGYVGAGRLIHAPYTGATVSYRGMYPNPIAIRRPGRYDTGGVAQHGALMENMSHRPERVLSPRQTDSFERLVDGLLSGVSIPAGQSVDGVAGGDVYYTVNHVPGFTTARDLQRVEERRQQRVRAGRRG
jgi:TP901 family phage tail tape measure protein